MDVTLNIVLPVGALFWRHNRSVITLASEAEKMKADIDTSGELNIFGENDVELYALKKWFEDWQKGKSTLNVPIVIISGRQANIPHSYDMEKVSPPRECDFCSKHLLPEDEQIDTLHIEKGSVCLCRECFSAAGNDVR